MKDVLVALFRSINAILARSVDLLPSEVVLLIAPGATECGIDRIHSHNKFGPSCRNSAPVFGYPLDEASSHLTYALYYFIPCRAGYAYRQSELVASRLTLTTLSFLK
jgi:hypothetical protein